MSLFSRFFSSSSSGAFVVGGEEQVLPSETMSSFGATFEKVSVLLLILVMAASYYFSRSVIDEKQVLARGYYQILEDKLTEQKNLESLRLLVSRQEDIVRDRELFSRVLPESPQVGHVLTWIEYLFELLRKDFFVSSPALISWRPLSQQELSSDIFRDLGVTEFSFRYEGSYDGFVQLLSLLRTSQRLVDVRSFRNLSYKENALISVDLTFWTYHLLGKDQGPSYFAKASKDKRAKDQ